MRHAVTQMCSHYGGGYGLTSTTSECGFGEQQEVHTCIYGPAHLGRIAILHMNVVFVD